MRELSVLLLVFIFSGAANAGVVDIWVTSINGQAISPVKEIAIRPSDTVDLSIIWDGVTGRYFFGLSSIIQKTGGPGILSLGSTLINPAFDPTLDRKGSTLGQQWIVEGALFDGIGVAGLTGQPQTLVSNILLHCDGIGDIIIKLLNYAPGGGSIEVDSNLNSFTPTYGTGVIIHQIPEPMTLMLLGLGSLYLLRRKK